MRKRMEWDWVDGVAIIVFTTWLDHNKFKVELMQGMDAKPSDKPWKSYIQEGCVGKGEVVRIALIKAKTWLEKEADNDKD